MIFMPPTKSLRSGTWAITLLAAIRSARRPSAPSREAESRPKNSHDRLDAASPAPPRPRSRPARCRAPGCRARRRAGADSRRCWPPPRRGCRCPRPKRSTASRRIARVGDPGVRVRREVRVLREDLLRGDELLELHQQAALADPHVQRIERLHRARPLGRHIALAQRRHAEVDERVAQGRRRRSGSREGRPPPAGIDLVSKLDGHPCRHNAAAPAVLTRRLAVPNRSDPHPAARRRTDSGRWSPGTGCPTKTFSFDRALRARTRGPRRRPRGAFACATRLHGVPSISAPSGSHGRFPRGCCATRPTAATGSIAVRWRSRTSSRRRSRS